jgi:hypothetical protein
MISTNLHLWPFVAEAQRRGAKVVVIDPVRHRTAAHADWYIPIRPGTDGALALALMNVIIGEGLADEAYVRDSLLEVLRARGFEVVGAAGVVVPGVTTRKHEESVISGGLMPFDPADALMLFATVSVPSAAPPASSPWRGR